MKIVIINGTNHKGSTEHIARITAEKIGGEISEFFLPKDFGEFCTGCTNCFMKAEEKCPHYEKLSPLTNALDEADVIILASPVYVYHVSGAMKAFLDHYGYRWLIHRPNDRMFKKQAVCVTTAAGGGMSSTLKDMSDSLFFWGVPKQYKIGLAVSATSWDKVNSKKKKIIEKKTNSIAKKIQHKNGKVKTGIKTKAFFYLMRALQKNGWNEVDVKYWNEKGWSKKARPWK